MQLPYQLPEAEITWEGDLRITNVERKGPVIEISITRNSAPEQGAVTLVFEHTPIRLLGWWLVDGSGNRVQVRIQSQAHGVDIDPDRFQFRPTDY